MTDIFKLDTSKITNEFITNMSRLLLQNYIICVNNSKFQICEIEFYINSESHPDTYTHGDVLQKNYGKIYFHRMNGKSYKGGTFKGMDLTFGNKDMYFGILIRSMYDIDNKKMICGPCNCVDAILELNNCNNIGEFMKSRQEPFDAQTDIGFRFVKSDIVFKDEIYAGTRIGLSDKYPEWKNKLYRFVSRINLIKKEKKKLIMLE
jgi:3-methyladenine DNA glycosylase Mpg